MDKIKFNYRNRKGQPIEVNIPLDEIKKFEGDYKGKLINIKTPLFSLP